ncbi:MAG: CRISPR-associated protein Cas4 [Chloroflexi bacterium]|nr:CRISPR-associated protein Cas4 [Chloroflexota bacterium]
MPDASEDDRLVPISALQHFAFCERQCALIHVERAWAENELTAEGRVVHGEVDTPGISGQGRVARAVQLRCERLGLVGQADLVEFLPAPQAGPAEVPFPVEYKRGRRSERAPDRIQLCAQALSLEEMTGTAVPRGAIFYHASRRRVVVEFDPDLRRRTEAIAAAVREMLDDGRIPSGTLEPKCRRCSLREICQPATPGRQAASAHLAAIAREAAGGGA